MDQQAFRELNAKVSDLERQVKFLMQLNGLDLSALRTAPDEELLKYYQDCVQLLGIPPTKYPEQVIGVWAEKLALLSELELTRLQEIVDYEHTWEPFYTLAIRMLTGLRQHKEFGKDPIMQQTYAFLDRSRRNLKEIAVLMIEKYPESLSEKSQALLSADSPENYL
jgi:hypothetical protein